MKTYTIRHITRLPNSRNGNPRFKIELEGGPGEWDVMALTSSDHSFAYAVGNSDMREGSTVTVEFTRSGRISHMEPVK